MGHLQAQAARAAGHQGRLAGEVEKLLHIASHSSVSCAGSWVPVMVGMEGGHPQAEQPAAAIVQAAPPCRMSHACPARQSPNSERVPPQAAPSISSMRSLVSAPPPPEKPPGWAPAARDRKSTRLNSSHLVISY